MQRVALVTGGSRGIGRGIAEKLRDEGYAVAVTSRNELALEGIYCIKADNAVAEDRERVLQCVLEKWGHIDLLVNNAGVAPLERKDLLEMSEDSMRRLLDINLIGPFFMTQSVAKIMEKQQSGTIITIASCSSYAVSVNRGEYCVSKAGLSMMTQLFAARMAECGVRVYEIRPGIIATDMTSGVKDKYDRLIEGGITPIKRWGYPEDIANAVLVLASGKLAFSTGEVINVDGGFHISRL